MTSINQRQATGFNTVDRTPPHRAHRVLTVDFIGLRFNAQGQPDASAVKANIETRGVYFIVALRARRGNWNPGKFILGLSRIMYEL